MFEAHQVHKNKLLDTFAPKKYMLELRGENNLAQSNRGYLKHILVLNRCKLQSQQGAKNNC